MSNIHTIRSEKKKKKKEKKEKNILSGQGRIVGGEVANDGEFPFQVRSSSMF